MSKYVTGALLKRLPDEEDRAVSATIRAALSQLYESITCLKDDAEDLDKELGWILAGYHEHRFTD